MSLRYISNRVTFKTIQDMITAETI